MIVNCPKCDKKFRLGEEKTSPEGVRLRCTGCRGVFIAGVSEGAEQKQNYKAGLRALVAHGDPEICRLIKGLLDNENIATSTSQEGKETMDIIESQRPDVVFIDVALPGIYGVVACERIKNTPELKDTKVVLVASVFDKTRYKRAPDKLYGADDYVETDNLEDEVVPKLRHMFPDGAWLSETRTKSQKPGRSGVKSPSTESSCATEQDKSASHDDQELHQKAKRLARIIVADILLYHRKKFDLDLNKVNICSFFKSEIAEGIKYFNKRFPAIEADSYLIEAFKDALSQKSAIKNNTGRKTQTA